MKKVITNDNDTTEYDEIHADTVSKFVAHKRTGGYLSAAIQNAYTYLTDTNKKGNVIGDSEARETLIAWGVEAGYSESHARNTVSAILFTVGKGNSRKPPRVDERAPALLAQVTASYGKDAAKVLLSAYRLAKRNAEQTAKAA